MRYLLIIIFVVQSAFFATFAQTDPTTTYVLPNNQLAFDYPSDWLVVSNTQFDTVLMNNAKTWDTFDREGVLPARSAMVVISSFEEYLEATYLDSTITTPEEFMDNILNAWGEAVIGSVETITLSNGNTNYVQIDLGNQQQWFYMLDIAGQSYVFAVIITDDVDLFHPPILAVIESARALEQDETGRAVLTDVSELTELVTLKEEQITLAHPLTWASKYWSDNDLSLGSNGQVLTSSFYSWEADDFELSLVTESQFSFLEEDVNTLTLEEVATAYLNTRSDIIEDLTPLEMGGHPAYRFRYISRDKIITIYFLDLGEAGYFRIQLWMLENGDVIAEAQVTQAIESINNPAILDNIEPVEIGESSFAFTISNGETFTPANTTYEFFFGQDQWVLRFRNENDHYIALRFEETFASGTHILDAFTNRGAVYGADYEIPIDPVNFEVALYEADAVGTLVLSNDSRTISAEIEYTVPFKGYFGFDGEFEPEETYNFPATMTVTGSFINLPIPR